MGIPTHIVDGIASVTNLCPENFAEHRVLMLEFFRAAGLDHVIAETAPATLSPAVQKLDDECSFLLFSKVDPVHRNILSNVQGARARWTKLVDSWSASTFVDLIMTFEELLNVEHDPGHHISVFTEGIDTLCKDLQKRGLPIPDDIRASILLARLHSSMSSTLHSLCSGTALPTFEAAVARLRLDAHNAHSGKVKAEPFESHVSAMAARVPYPPDGTPPPEAFAGGFSWCSPRSDRDCFRCGRSGHRAQFCMAVMPEAVVQWILVATRSRSSASDSQFPTLAGPKGHETARLASSGIEEELDDDQDYGDWSIPWEVLSPDQIKAFLERNIKPSRVTATTETARLARITI